MLAQYKVAVKQNVQVQRTRAVLDSRSPIAAKFSLHLQQSLEQRARRKVRFKRHRRIQKTRLLGHSHRPG